MYEYDDFQAIAVAVEIVLKWLNHQMKDEWQNKKKERVKHERTG